MASSSSSLDEAPKKPFSFPFDPYPQQEELMKQIYSILSEGRIGCVESPTGTGKSLSLLCASLTWLFETEAAMKKPISKPDSMGGEANNSSAVNVPSSLEALVPSSSSSADPPWVRDHLQQQQDDQKSYLLRASEAKLAKRQSKLRRRLRKRKRSVISSSSDNGNGNDDDDESLVLIPFEDLEANDLNADNSDSDSDDDEDKPLNPEQQAEEEDPFITPKIIYCSRTHSQLSQLVGEIKRTSFAPRTRMTILASRRSLCIHKDVSQLSSSHAVNEACLELQEQSSSSKKHKCPFLDQKAIHNLRDHMQARVLDVEELMPLSKSLGACPYYSSRRALPSAQLVLCPYQTLFHKETRASVGLSSLKGCSIIIDEAHNAIDTVLDMHSVSITAAQLMTCFASLSSYTERYQSRLSAKNLGHLRQLLSFLKSVAKYIGHGTSAASASSSSSSSSSSAAAEEKQVLRINQFVFDAGIDCFNLHQMVDFIHRSEMNRKLRGFQDKVTSQQSPQQVSLPSSSSSSSSSSSRGLKQAEDPIQSASSCMHALTAILQALTSDNQDGRVVLVRSHLPSSTVLKFMSLNASNYFKDIFAEAHSVVFAGGTMQPFGDFENLLLDCKFSSSVSSSSSSSESSLQRGPFSSFSCAHVVPAENVAPVVLSTGPTNVPLEFTHKNRDSVDVMDELGRIVVNLCNVVPDGICLFFPSYAYESQVLERWKSSGALQRMEKLKHVLREPRCPTAVDDLLRQYKTVISSSFPLLRSASASGSSESTPMNIPSHATHWSGAILTCVMGGKLSEGLNFSDGLGRCVVVVGMPYPNAHDPELKERMAQADLRAPQAGSELYENMCMRMVNQSIGRAVRHSKDYASIVLCDKRYARPAIQAKLPNWIRSSFSHPAVSSSSDSLSQHPFGPAFSLLARFFAGKKPQQEEQERARLKAFSSSSSSSSHR